MSECPYCQGRYGCHLTDGSWQRHWNCYEDQIDALQALLREAVNLIEHLETHYLEWFHSESQNRIADILDRPEVKAAVEE